MTFVPAVRCLKFFNHRSHSQTQQCDVTPLAHPYFPPDVITRPDTEPQDPQSDTGTVKNMPPVSPDGALPPDACCAAHRPALRDSLPAQCSAAAGIPRRVEFQESLASKHYHGVQTRPGKTADQKSSRRTARALTAADSR